MKSKTLFARTLRVCLLGLLPFASLPGRAANITNDLVVHLSFDNNFQDSSGRGNDGTPVGSPNRIPGKIGANALQFSSASDGSSFNYVSLGAPLDLDFGDSTDFTLAMWVSFTNWSGDPAFISNKSWVSGSNPGYVLSTAGDGHFQWNFKERDNGRKDYDGPSGTLPGGAWHHIAVVFQRAGTINAFIDGVLVNSSAARTAAEVPSTIDTSDLQLNTNIGQDGTGEYTDGGGVGISDGLIDDVGIWRRALSDTEIFRIYSAGLSGADLRNVPEPTTPFVGAANPSDNSTGVSPSIILTVNILNATTDINTNSIQLFFDGASVTPTIQKSGSTNRISFDPPGLLAPLSDHTYRVIFSDNGTPPVVKTNDFRFTVTDYPNIVLPAPIILETFDTTPEGEIPSGWTRTNFTASLNSVIDLQDPTSDAYLDWTVISRQRVIDIGNNASPVPSWGSAIRLNVREQIVNGVRVENLISNHFVYAESDIRGGSQVQFLFSPDFNLTGQSNIHVSYHSIYEQNQDSIGAVEYSVNGGATWLPIVYMIDGVDVIRDSNGNIDAAATLNEPRGDTAVYVDPVTGEDRGGTYGAFIAADPATFGTLGPFISPRVDDDPIESKRVEVFRLPAADGQSRVRFRFAQAGTASWYFGIDDFGLYSIAPGAGAKPATPTITAPATTSFFGPDLAFSGSAFSSGAASNIHATTLWQISGSSAMTPADGLANPLVSITSSTDLTSLRTNLLGRLFPGRTYYITAQYRDQNAVKSDFATPAAFAIEALPAPVFLEMFESVPDFDLPAGWSRSNQTDVASAGLDPANPSSDTYLDWTVVPFSVLQSFGGGRTDTNVVSGKSIYAESDNRSGNQIQYLFTPPFDLRGHNNVWVAFRSNYVQNQDNIGVLEYTINGGQTWLPVVYLLNDKASNSDIIRTNGVIDTTATLGTTATDIAKMIDPATGARVAAGKYADFIAARPIGDLSPFISGRIDDDKTESLRYERFRLPAADNQAAVQFRFVQAGTGSWWWGVDDFGLYSLAGSAELRINSVAASGNNITIAWTGAPGVKLQKKNTLTDAQWQDVPNTLGNSTATETIGAGMAFYRLIKS